MWLLKLPFNQNSIMINHNSSPMVILIATSLLDELKRDMRGTCSITRIYIIKEQLKIKREKTNFKICGIHGRSEFVILKCVI
jgi:hypothetical protein